MRQIASTGARKPGFAFSFSFQARQQRTQAQARVKMAPRARSALAPPLCLLAAASLLVAAAAPARPGGGVCTSALVSLSPCVDYMGGNEATALARCCSQLRSVSRSRLQCPCAALRVDRTRELSLTAACGVQTWGLRVGCSDHQ